MDWEDLMTRDNEGAVGGLLASLVYNTQWNLTALASNFRYDKLFHSFYDAMATPTDGSGDDDDDGWLCSQGPDGAFPIDDGWLYLYHP